MITVYPFKLGGNGKYDDGEYDSWAGQIYLHGKLEQDNGYDICGVNNIPKEDGVYDCEVMMNDGNDIRKAKLFYWMGKEREGMIIDKNGTRYGTWRRERGLIVQIGDDKYMKDAQEKFDERTEYL